ncbi:MAG: DUF502 domain-containing protein [Nitrospirae bacterium]|nr:DUF502 domain-containing protein [Nitrospirota bacterium]
MSVRLHFKRNMVRGALTLIPLALSWFALDLVYNNIDQGVAGLALERFGVRVPGLGLLLFLIGLYLVGLLAGNVVGGQLLRWTERIMAKVPLLKTTYRIGQQLSQAMQLPEREMFREVVLVQFLTPGVWTVGFVTGTVQDEVQGELLLKVYVPTPPNPTSGTMVLARREDTRNPGWTVEQALQMVISAGIIGPDRISAPSAAGG